MPNRQLSKTELENLAHPLLKEIRGQLKRLAANDEALLWALRRKITKELLYDERGKPGHRTALKKRKRIEQEGLCAICRRGLPAIGAILDRFEAMPGYTDSNTRLLCPEYDREVQEQRGYC